MMPVQMYCWCSCYCPHCKHIHCCQVPDYVARTAVEKSEAKDAQRLFYRSGLGKEFQISRRFLPRVECDTCCQARVGMENFKEVQRCSAMLPTIPRDWK